MLLGHLSLVTAGWCQEMMSKSFNQTGCLHPFIQYKLNQCCNISIPPKTKKNIQEQVKTYVTIFPSGSAVLVFTMLIC